MCCASHTNSLSSLCFSSVSFRIMFACASLVSSSFSLRSLCLNTFSRFCEQTLIQGVTEKSQRHTFCFHSGRACAVSISTASRWSYCEMRPLSFSARALFSWHSLVLRLLCSSIWAWISLSVPWKWVVISFLFRSSSLHLCRVSSCRRISISQLHCRSQAVFANLNPADLVQFTHFF